jgi:hypothetical protein
MRLDDGAEARQRAVDDGVDLFGVEALRQRRRSHQVEEQDAHLAQRLPGGRVGPGELGEPGAKAGQRRVDDRSRREPAAALERGDAGFELWAGETSSLPVFLDRERQLATYRARAAASHA